MPEIEVSLRDKKAAQMRVHLFKTAWQLMNTDPGPGSSVESICAAAEVTKRTFFKYFASKDDVLIYAAKAWNMEYAAKDKPTGLAGLAHLVQAMCAYNETYPEYLLGPILSTATHMRENRDVPLTEMFARVQVSSLEQCLLAGVPMAYDRPQAPTLAHLVIAHLEEAKVAAEIREEIDLVEWTLAILGTLYGAVLIAAMRPDRSIEKWLLDHLDKVLAGCRA